MKPVLRRIGLLGTVLAACLPAYSAVQLEVSPDSLRLSGTVSSMAQRECLRSLLRGASSKLLLDHLEIDRRQMVRWMPVMLELLGTAAPALATGSLRLEGDGITVSGAVRSPEDKEDLLRQMDALRQPGLAIEVALSVRDPEPEPWIEASFCGPELTVTGQVSLPETSHRLQTDFPGASVAHTEGSARSASWEAELVPALPNLLAGIRAEVADGSVRFAPGRVTIRGAVPDLGPKLRVTRIATSILGHGTLVENFLSADLPPQAVEDIAAKPPPATQPAKAAPPAAGSKPGDPRPPLPAAAPPPLPTVELPAIPHPAPPAITAMAPAASPALQGEARTLVFNRGSTWITPASRSLIESAITDFRALPASARLLIRSHVDAEGDPEVNLSLSKERAAGVRQALVKGGIASSRIETEIPPLPAESSPSERRVELILRP